MKRNDPFHIHAPKVSIGGGLARIVCDIEYDGQVKTVWFEVVQEYAEYLCHERSDAYVVGLLNLAMREGRDIICDVPVTEELLYQLNTYLIPSLARHGRAMYATKIVAKTDSSVLPNHGAVGTGLSCGVDSLHAIASHWKSEYPEKEITHLAIYNVGAFEDHEDQYQYQLEHAKSFCLEYGFNVITTNSNFHLMFDQCHLFAHTYRNCFCALLLQKFWKTYYVGSSGKDFSSFSLADNDTHDCAYYELLSLQCFSTRQLKFYSDGGAVTRFDKTRMLVDFEAAQKYLHVCVRNSGPNCNRCLKCCRTLIALDALGALEKFRAVFDIDYYCAHRRWYMRYLARQHLSPSGDKMLEDAYSVLRSRSENGLRFLDELAVVPRALVDVTKCLLKKNRRIEVFLRKILNRPDVH